MKQRTRDIIKVCLGIHIEQVFVHESHHHGLEKQQQHHLQ